MLLFILACQSSRYTLLGQYVPHRSLTPYISSKTISYRYEMVRTRTLTSKERQAHQKLFTLPSTLPDEIWTPNSSGIPSYLSKPQLFSLKSPPPAQAPAFTEIRHLTSPSLPSLQKQAVNLENTQAYIYGPAERISSDMLLLRTQVSRDSGQPISGPNHIEWDISLSKAELPVQKSGFVFQSPSHDVQHHSIHRSTVDQFAYSQLALQMPEVPFPSLLTCSLPSMTNQPTHTVLIHPAAFYVGIKAPTWSAVQQELKVETASLTPSGKETTPSKITIQLIGVSTYQYCQAETCSFKPNITGWHQILATATDEQERSVQSISQVFIYGPNLTSDPELLISEDRKQLLVQNTQPEAHLMLGFTSEKDLLLETHKLKQGYYIKNHDSPIDKATALLINGEQSIRIQSSSRVSPPSVSPQLPKQGNALSFDNIQLSYPKEIWLEDRAYINLLLPAGEGFTLSFHSLEDRVTFDSEYIFIEKRPSPSLFSFAVRAKKTGHDKIVLQSSQGQLNIPISIHSHVNQQPELYVGRLKVKDNTAGSKIKLPKGFTTLYTDTHAEIELLPHILHYLQLPPTTQNRMKRIQIVALCWDALFNSGEEYGKVLIEQTQEDISYMYTHWSTLSKTDLITWFETLILMSHGSIYVPTHYLIHAQKRIEEQSYSPALQAKLLYLQSFAQRLPIKAIIPPPDRQLAIALLDGLPSNDRLYIIPVLEKYNPLQHWTYTSYAKLFEQNTDRLLRVFYKIREYRYRINNLRQKASLNTHEGRIAHALHSRRHAINRYGLHVFLWQNGKIIQRGNHRRRDYNPIQNQLYLEQPLRQILTTKGKGELYYVISNRQKNITHSSGQTITQKIAQKGRAKTITIEFEILQPGQYWIFDQLPSGAEVYLDKCDWMEDLHKDKRHYWIKTQWLEEGRYSYTLPITHSYKGDYQDPPAILYKDDAPIGQSQQDIVTFNE